MAIFDTELDDAYNAPNDSESDLEPEKSVYYNCRGFEGHEDTESPSLVGDDEHGSSTPSKKSNGKRSTATRPSCDATESTATRAEFIRPAVPECSPYRLSGIPTRTPVKASFPASSSSSYGPIVDAPHQTAPGQNIHHISSVDSYGHPFPSHSAQDHLFGHHPRVSHSPSAVRFAHPTAPRHHGLQHSTPLRPPTAPATLSDMVSRSSVSVPSAQDCALSASDLSSPALVVDAMNNRINDYSVTDSSTGPTLTTDQIENCLEIMQRYETKDEIKVSLNFRRLYVTTPLGRLPSAAVCKKLAPTALQALKLVPIRKILFNPSGSTDSDAERIPANDIECTDPDPMSAEDTEPIDNDAEKTLRSNSSALFCFERGPDKIYRCKVLKEVDGATTVCNNLQGTASGRRKHLRRKHPAILADIEYFQEQQRRASLILERLKQDALPPTPSKSKRSKTAHILNINTGTAFAWSETQQQSAEHQLMRLIAMDGLSSHIAASENLKEFCRILNPQFRLPAHDTLQNRLRLKVLEKKRQTVNYLLANTDGGSITTDAWTCSTNKKKYLGITFHYMTRDYRMSSVVIGMEHLKQPRVTALVLTSVINRVVDEWSLTSKVVGMTSDQGANIKKGLQECEQNTGAYWVACTAHKMQLCINKAWSETKPLADITNRCVSIMSFFNNNSVARKLLNDKWGTYLIAARRVDGVPLLAQASAPNAVLPTLADGAPALAQLLPASLIPCANHRQAPPTDGVPAQASLTDLAPQVPPTDGALALAQLPSDDVEPIANPQPPVPSFRSLRYKQEEVTLVSANATRWDSKLAMISRFLDISPVLKTTFEALFQLDKISPEERGKFKTIEKLLPTDDELEILKETDKLLTPAADFTHWIGGSGYSTISQACIQAHSVLSNPEQFKTGAAILLYRNLKTYIAHTWPLDDIPDGMLLAMYLNPATATSTIWDLDNPRQVAERDAQIAAEEAAASLADPALDLAQDSRPDIARLPFKLSPEYRLRIPVEGPFTLPVDFPLQLAQTDAKTPPTNRLRAETLAYREIIRHSADKEIERRRNHGTSRCRDQADDYAVISDWTVSALCDLISYKAILSPANADTNKKYFKDPLAFWRTKEGLHNFIGLCAVARKFLSIQATSSESERLFSKAGVVYSARRSRLSDDSFRNIILFHYLEKTICQNFSV